MKTKTIRFSEDKGTALVRVIMVLGALGAAIVVAVALNGRSAAVLKDAVSRNAQPMFAPDFTLEDVSGGQMMLSEHKGKVVLVNFWATWCSPCRTEVPSFVKARQQYHDQGFEIIGISFDDDGPGPVRAFAQQFKIDYPVVMGTPEIARSYGSVDVLPTTFILDREGRIRRRHLGIMTFSDIETNIKPLL